MPSAVILVDAAILIAAVVGQSSSALLAVGERRTLATTARAVEEATRRLSLGMGRADLADAVLRLTSRLEVVPDDRVQALAGDAADALRDAPQSRNGSTGDAHMLALAWAADAEIWSHDRDFAGTGVASWSTINLLRALALAEGDA